MADAKSYVVIARDAHVVDGQLETRGFFANRTDAWHWAVDCVHSKVYKDVYVLELTAVDKVD